MEKTEQIALDTWAILEVFGHQVYAGKVSEHQLGNANLLRVDVPATDKSQSFTKFFSAGAIFSLTPTDEQTVMFHLSRNSEPVDRWTFDEMLQRRLREQREALAPHSEEVIDADEDKEDPDFDLAE